MSIWMPWEPKLQGPWISPCFSLCLVKSSMAQTRKMSSKMLFLALMKKQLASSGEVTWEPQTAVGGRVTGSGWAAQSSVWQKGKSQCMCLLHHGAKDKDDWKEIQIPARHSLLPLGVFLRLSLDPVACSALQLLPFLYWFSAILGTCISIIRREGGLFTIFQNRK